MHRPSNQGAITNDFKLNPGPQSASSLSLSTSSVKLGHCRDVRCMTALLPKTEVHPRSCYVANVPTSEVQNSLPHLIIDGGDPCTTPGGRRNANALFEGSIERSLGFISHERCDLRDTDSMALEVLRRDLKPPAAKILHRRHTDQGGKAFCER